MDKYHYNMPFMKDYNVDKAIGNHPQFYLKGGVIYYCFTDITMYLIYWGLLYTVTHSGET